MRPIFLAFGLLAGCSGSNGCQIEGEATEQLGLVIYDATFRHGAEVSFIELDTRLPDGRDARQEFLASDEFATKVTEEIFRELPVIFADDFDLVSRMSHSQGDRDVEIEGIWKIKTGEASGKCYRAHPGQPALSIMGVRDWREVEIFPEAVE